MSKDYINQEPKSEREAEERLTSRDLFCALETMIQQRTPEGFFPLPYVWYHHSQKNWWLSTERGSMAVGTFEQAVSALSISQNAERWHRANEVPMKELPTTTEMSENSNTAENPANEKASERLTSRDLFAFAEEYLVPVLRYTADKKGYIFEQESKYYTGMDREDFDDWAKARAKMAIEKWDAMREANSFIKPHPRNSEP